MIQLTVIGFWGAYPGPGEATSGYLLQSEGFNLLVECGSAVLSRLPGHVEPDALDAVLISHYHADHVADIQARKSARPGIRALTTLR